MIARARVVAEPDGRGGSRLIGLRSCAPLLVRPTPAGVYLVGGAAGPIGGDELLLEVVVEAGAVLTLRTAAASLVLSGPGPAPSRSTIEARVESGGLLRWLPEPLVAAAGCRHRASARIELDGRAALVWREEIALGRHGEQPGSLSARVAVDVAGRPVLRQELAVGEGYLGWDGPAVTGGRRAVGSVVVADPAFAASPPPPAVLEGGHAAVLPLAGPAAQVTAVGIDAPELRRRLGWGLVELGRGSCGQGTGSLLEAAPARGPAHQWR